MGPTDLPWQRLDSQSKDYFPTVVEILANDEAVNKHLNKMNLNKMNEESVSFPSNAITISRI